MTGKMRLYVGLLVVGLVLLGSGLWFLLNPILRINATVKVPESTPVIAMETVYTMGGIERKLFLYEEGTIIYYEHTGLRPTQVRTQTWSTGKLTEEELSNLLEFIYVSGFESLNSHYNFPGIPVPTENSPNAIKSSDLQCTIEINTTDLQKVVTADSYLSPDEGMTYPDMPYPLNEVYRRLRDIEVNKTEEVYKESQDS